MNKVYIHISHSLYKTCGVNCYTKWNNEIHISHSLYKTACGELDVMEFMGFTYHIVYIKPIISLVTFFDSNLFTYHIVYIKL